MKASLLQNQAFKARHACRDVSLVDLQVYCHEIFEKIEEILIY